MAEIEVPPFFLCPISLQIMKDPVTISTGITYDRDAIERWISNTPICPVTNQALQGQDLTPNITLRRLIQSWCTLHAVDRLPTPKSPATRAEIHKLLEGSRSLPTQLKSLQGLKLISDHSLTNRRSLESAGAVETLATIVSDNTAELSKNPHLSDELTDLRKGVYEALSILYSIKLSESSLKPLANAKFVETLTLIMQHGSYDSRVYAVMLLKPILEGSDPSILNNLPSDFFTELGQILKDQISEKATNSTLETLIGSCQWGRNPIKAAESGVVPVLIDLLLESSHPRRASEMGLMLLDILCQCAEGRSALLSHGAGLAIISKKILRVSKAASESAVRVLHSISRFSATREVLQEMLQIGVVTKLCMVIQVDCGTKTREKAKDVLRAHARAWKTSAACVPSSLMALYPD